MSARPTARRRTLLFLLAAAGTLCAPARPGAASPEVAADSATLDTLMGLLSQRRHRMAQFEQTQYLAVLKRPLISSGVLLYEAPDHLEQRTLKPRPQSLVIDRGLMTLRRGGRERTLRLADYPQAAPLIESVRATLAGDRAALERMFALQWRGELAHWELLLVPRDTALAAQVQRIGLRGEAASITQVEVLQTGGDRSVMRITTDE